MEEILNIRVNYQDALTQVAKYNAEIKEMKAGQKELNAQLKQGEITQNEYNKSNAEMELVVRRNRESLLVLNKAIKDNIQYEKQQEGSVSKLRIELSSLRKTYDSLSSAERSAAKGVELEAKIKSLSTEIKGAEEATDRFQRSVGNYENAIKNVIGQFVPFGDQMLDITDNMGDFGGATQTAFQSAKASVSAFGKALLALLANPVFATIAGIVGVGMAFKFWYDYNQGIAEATRLTQQLTGLAGADLKTMRAEVSATAKVFDKDFKEVLQSSNALSKQFGISAREALDIINDGLIAGGDANGEFVQSTKEYATFFKEAGLSASEFVAYIAQTSDKGIWSDKGADAIKEASLSIRELTDSTRSALQGIGIDADQVQKDLLDGTKTTFDVIQDISTQLSVLPENSAEVGTAIADIFRGAGEDAGLQYLTTLKDIELNLDTVKDKSGILGELQEQQLQTQIELDTAIAALFDKTGGGFEKLTIGAEVFFKQGLTDILKGIISITNGIIDIYNESMPVRIIFESFIGIFKILYDVSKTVFDIIVSGFVATGEAFGSLLKLDFKGAKDAIVDWAINVKDAVVDGFNDIVDDVDKSISNIAERKLKPIVIPISTSTDTSGGSVSSGTTTTTSGGSAGVTIAEINTMQKGIEALAKAREQVVKDFTKQSAQILSDIEKEMQLFETQERERIKLTKEGAQKRLKAIEDEYENRRLVEGSDADSLDLVRQEEMAKLDLILSYDAETKSALYDSELAYQNAVLQGKQRVINAETAIAQQQRQNIDLMIQTAETAVGSFADVFNTMAEDNAAFAGFAKGLALFEIAINTAKAISAIPSMSAAGDPYTYALRVATGIATVLSNISSAYSIINSAQQPETPTFATGGYISGLGSGTSDSIMARISSGESINNANSTSMFGSLYSALNVMGGGVPFYVGGSNDGEDMLARAFARGARSLPSPRVAVDEISTVSDRVSVVRDIRKI